MEETKKLTAKDKKLTASEKREAELRAQARAEHRTMVMREPCSCSLCGVKGRCVKVSMQWTVVYVCDGCLGMMQRIRAAA